MQCPNDKTDLVMSDRQGIEIDYCPKCRGVWLDRGELDKIIERSEQVQPNPTPQQQSYQEPRYPQQQYDKHGGDHDRRNDYPRKERKESFLSDLFG